MKNDFLETKEDKIDSLFASCNNEDEKNLIYDLLEKFVTLNVDKYNMLLNHMVDYIVDLNLDYSITQIVATSMDSEADSSQGVLQAIKHKLAERDIYNFTTVNDFNKSVQNYHKGLTNIIVVDELVGSGKTVKNREKTFVERIQMENEYNLHFVYLAGVEYFVEKIKESGINIFCAFPLKRGISDFFQGEELENRCLRMLEMEARLAPQINEKELSDYSFGYGKAEALYTAESCLNNTPNSVFPIFWWKRDNNFSRRNTLFTRYEKGF